MQGTEPWQYVQLQDYSFHLQCHRRGCGNGILSLQPMPFTMCKSPIVYGQFFSVTLLSELHLPQESNPCLNVHDVFAFGKQVLPQLPPSSLPGSSDHPPTISHGATAPRAWNTGSLPGIWPSSDGHLRTRTPSRRGCQFLVWLCLSEESFVTRVAFLK